MSSYVKMTEGGSHPFEENPADPAHCACCGNAAETMRPDERDFVWQGRDPLEVLLAPREDPLAAAEARGYARAMRDAEAWHRARAAELLADERAGHAREIVDAHLRSANAFAAMAARPEGNDG